MAISHTSQTLWLYDCGDPWLSSKGRTTNKVYQNLHQAYLLEMGLMQLPTYHKNLFIINCVRPCRLFVHDNFFGPLGLYMLVQKWTWTVLAFWLVRDLRIEWSWAFSLICCFARVGHIKFPYYSCVWHMPGCPPSNTPITLLVQQTLRYLRKRFIKNYWPKKKTKKTVTSTLKMCDNPPIVCSWECHAYG